MVSLDALLNYKVVNPQVMLYNTQNLPRMMSKVLQAQLRNVAGSLDVDQLIESTAGLNRVGAEMKRISTRWGVHVEFVKVQKVDAGGLVSVSPRPHHVQAPNHPAPHLPSELRPGEEEECRSEEQAGAHFRQGREADGCDQRRGAA